MRSSTIVESICRNLEPEQLNRRVCRRGMDDAESGETITCRFRRVHRLNRRACCQRTRSYAVIESVSNGLTRPARRNVKTNARVQVDDGGSRIRPTYPRSYRYVVSAKSRHTKSAIARIRRRGGASNCHRYGGTSIRSSASSPATFSPNLVNFVPAEAPRHSSVHVSCPGVVPWVSSDAPRRSDGSRTISLADR